jgi:hypothetical protein
MFFKIYKLFIKKPTDGKVKNRNFNVLNYPDFMF